MKLLQLLSQQLSHWRQVGNPSASHKRSSSSLNDTSRQNNAQSKAQTKGINVASASKPWQTHLILRSGRLVQTALHPHAKRRKSSAQLPNHQPAILVLAILTLSSAIGYRFYNDPQLAVGTIAPQTLRAPASARVEDVETTAENRQAARMGSTPVLTVDQTVNQEIYQSLQRLLDEGDAIRQEAGAFPFVDPTTVLSTASQHYLRQAPEADWQAAIAASGANTSVNLIPTPNGETSDNNSLNSSQQLAIIELQNYRQTSSVEEFTALKRVISRARQRYIAAIKLLAGSSEEPSSFFDTRLLSLTDAEWNSTRSGIRKALERVLLQGVAQGLPDSLIEAAVKAQVAVDVPPAGAPIAAKVLMTVIEPNLAENAAETRLRAEQAALAVEPQIVSIRRGELIVEAGQPITQSDFVLLDHFGMSRRGVNWVGLVGFGALVSGAVVVFLLVERRFHPGLRRRDHILLVLLTLTTPLVVALAVPTTTLPLVGLLAGSFYGSILGATVVVLIGVALPIGLEISGSQLLASAIAGLLGAVMAGRLRSREELAMLGGAVGLTQGLVYLILSLILNTAASPIWYGLLTATTLQALLGVACSVVALGLSPYLENLFDLITPVRLAELSNPNRPLLKRLAAEAPGTFQHTLFVSSLAEAAARALGCNVELVRAGTLYHDIGKMHDAMGFIENQMGKPNKHDAIDDPWKSCKIIKKHVSEGLVMARRYRLPKAVQAFIPEHQGTMLIAYFHHQAVQRAKEDANLVVNESEFRYDGPVPQSRETGIVMLADSCEAALRSLKDTTSEEALAMVNRILRARWQDNQLVDSGLTRSEMTRIAEIFVRVWQQFNHQRIAYPKLSPNTQSVGSKN